MDIVPSDGQVITQSLALKPGTYVLPDGLTINADHVTLDGNGATLVGRGREKVGVKLSGRRGVSIRNLRIREYTHGIQASECRDLTIQGCDITSMAEVPPNTDFLDIWRPATDPYGGGILLTRVVGAELADNRLMHQMNGLLTYHCRELTIKNNIASYNSGFGFHLFDTSDSLFEANNADYCCRYQPRGEDWGHLGADAAGFLIVAGSSDNQFVQNVARLGGDGFFLAGLNPQFEHRPCNNNLFLRNDGSYSPNIAFEATFSEGNVFRENKANFCNYGFWLGFSLRNTVEDNDIYANRGAGVAVENGVGFKVSGNTIRGNGHGILLWSKHVLAFDAVVPENDTSRDWQIEGNTFTRNSKAIRIAADQDHGVRPYEPQGKAPQNHTIRGNTFEAGAVGIELAGVKETTLENNSFVSIQQQMQYL